MKKENKKIKELKQKVKEKKEYDSMETKSKVSKEFKSELKSLKISNKKPKGNPELTNSQGNIIDVHNMSKTFVMGNGKQKVLKDVNLTIKKKDFVAILGPSGSGKSTLLNILSGLDRPTSGEVIVNNINISTLSNKNLTVFRRKNIGFIFQSYNLLNSLNAKDNAKIGAALQKENNKKMDIEEIFNSIGMADKINSNIQDLSGGQQQRVSIARALAKNPNIIFADEPTAALDEETSTKVLKLFNEINKKYGTTIVIVTHDNNIKKIVNKVIEVRNGKASVK